jgi:molybdopterin-guanine dinucleotide biosynthesis protein A
MIATQDLTAMILAGGEGRRMGGRDKGLETFSAPGLPEAPLIRHVAERFYGQTAELLINANRNLDIYRQYGDRVIEDAEAGFQGPLMGIYSGLRAAQSPWLLIAPCDSPALPMDLVARMVAGIGLHAIGVADDGERMHPVVALIRTDLADDLLGTLQAGERKIDRWYARHPWCRIDISDCPEAFANLNTPEEKSRLEAALDVRLSFQQGAL